MRIKHGNQILHIMLSLLYAGSAMTY